MNVKNIFKKQNVMPVIVLSVICLAVALLVSGINLVTRDFIKREEERRISESLQIVMEGGEFGAPEALPEGAPKTVTAIYKEKNGKGHVVTLSKQGYASIIKITVGIDENRKITSAVITSEEESHGKSGIDEYVASFSGASAGAIDGIVSSEHVSGATRTSEHIGNAIYDAFVALGYATAKDTSEDSFDYAGVTATTDDTAIEIAKELMAGEYTKASTEGMPSTVRSVYKCSNGGYAIHVATRTKYVPLESEGIVTVNAGGYITGVKMLNWTVGYDKELLSAPPQYTEEFLNSYVGKYNSSLSRVEHVTNATLTSDNFTNAIKAALDVLYPVPVFSVLTVIAVAVAAVASVTVYIVFRIRRKKNEKVK